MGKGVASCIQYYSEHYAECEYPRYWRAWDELRTDAPNGMSVNRIPATAIRAYAQWHGLTRAEWNILDFIMRHLDDHHVAAVHKRDEKQLKSHG